MLSEKIKKYRLDNNLTQEEFASLIFVTRNAVSKWENNNGYPNLDTLKDLAKIMNTTIDDLLSEGDVKTIAIITNDKINKIKKYGSNVIVFILYNLVAILIPHLMFESDPTSPMAYCLFIGPVSFALLGIMTPLINKNMLHSFIASALAITPILIYYEVETRVVMYKWEIVYYLIFILSYCLMLIFLKLNLKKNIYKTLKIISLSLFIFLVLTYIVLCIISFITYDVSYSAPIYTEPLIYTLIFIVPITITFIVHYIFKRKESRV